MILTILYYLFITLLLLLLLKELVPYITYKMYYEKQGIKYYHIPVFGMMSKLFTPNDKDVLSGLKKFSREHKDEDLVVFNDLGFNKVFMINKKELMAKYFLKEVDHTVRINLIDMPFSMGFFMESGQKATKARVIFNEFFKPNNLKKNTASIQKIISKRFEELREEGWGSETKNLEFKEFEMKEFFPKVFSQVVNEILFGKDDYPEFEGKSLPETIDKLVEEMIGAWQNPLNILTFGWATDLGLMSQYNKAYKYGQHVNEEILKLVKRRKKKSAEDLELNMIDLMLKHNLTATKSDQLDLDSMVANVTLFQIGGAETTKNSLEATVKLISNSPKTIEKISKEVTQIFKNEEDFLNYDNYEKCEFMNNAIDEGLRMIPPAGVTVPRRVIKDMKIGKYTIKKGEKLTIPITAFQFNEDDFDAPDKFDDTRFNKSNARKIKRNSYMPFYSGKKSCLGKYLAELLIRMIIANLVRKFEVKGDGVDPKIIIVFAIGVDSCKLLLKPRVD